MSQNPSIYFDANKLDPCFQDEGHSVSVTLIPNTTFKQGTVLGQVTNAAVNDVQTVSITGGPTGGTFTLTYNGQTTSAIPFSATAAQVQSALSALPNIGSGQVLCSGGALPGTAVVVTFAGMMSGLPINPITINGAALTGGTPVPSVAHTTTGVAGGRFKPYAAGNSDGSQNPRVILAYEVVTDDRGGVMLGTGITAGEQGSYTTTMAYYRGVFKNSDCTGVDNNMVIGANSVGAVILGKDATDPNMVFTLN